MADDGSASNPRDPIKSSVWNVAGQIRRQQAVTVSKKIRELLTWAKRQCKVGTNGDDADEMMIDEEQPILEGHTNIAVEELKSAVQYNHLPKELEMTSSMASSSSSRSRRYDVFPSFSGEDVRKSFLSHLLKELDRRLASTFIDHGIERSHPIGTQLLLAIRESRIAIVIFSKKYASSTWCLNELVEIHKCYKKLNQMVIPIFYNVDPSEVRKQTGEFGKVFNKTCKDKTEDQKHRWMQALADVANLAGEDLHNWPDEAAMIEKITNDVFNKLITPSDYSGDFVGIEAHLEAIKKMLCLGSKEVIMVGIVGPSGIGKSTIGRALFSQLSSEFHHRSFLTYERKSRDHSRMRLCWQEQFISDILCQKIIKIEKLGVVEKMLKHKKVLIFLDDVDDLELLRTLVGQTGWFGPQSRIIVITQDRRLLKAHEIDRIYEVEFPSEALALKMLCQSAFGQNSPPGGFMELAVDVAKLAGNLPLGLSVLGSSLKGRGKDEWIEMLPRLQNDLDGNIEKTLRVSYDRLDRKEQELFLFLAFACLSERNHLSYIRKLLGDSVNIGLKMLAEKSLIRITPEEFVEMHNLLQKLAREIVRKESIDNPGKRRYLVDVEDIRDVFTDKTGTETVLGIYLKRSDINEPLFIDEKSFIGMLNLQFLIVSDGWMPETKGRVYLPQGLTYLPRKLRLLDWCNYPSKYLPCNFKAEFLVELRMWYSKLEKLWEGTQPLRSLKKIYMNDSRYLKEIPDLSNAINLEELDLSGCESLVTLPSSIQNAIKLRKLNIKNCTKLVSLPTLLTLKSLESLNLKGCFRLRNFPQVYCQYNQTPFRDKIEVEDCVWNKNLHGVDFLDCLRRCVPRQFRTEHMVNLSVRDTMIEKLWEGVQSLGCLEKMDLSECGNLKEFPDLSKAINLKSLKLNNCKSLVTVPSTIRNLKQLRKLEMKGCTGLEVLPTDVNLSSLKTLDLSCCKRLISFPQISWSIPELYLNDTAIEEVPCCIENFSMLTRLYMRRCKRLKNISANIFRLRRLRRADFSECVEVTALGDASVVETTEEYFSGIFFVGTYQFMFYNCFNLDGDARELILRSCIMPTVLPGGNIPKYFTHRASGNSLTVNLPQSSFSQLGFKSCVVLEPISKPKAYAPYLGIRWNVRGGWHYRYIELGLIYNTDHLVLVPLSLALFRPIAPPSELEYNDVTFEFSVLIKHPYILNPSQLQIIRGCGIRVLDMSPSPDGSDGSKKPMR